MKRSSAKSKASDVDPIIRCDSVVCQNPDPHNHGRDCDRCGWEYAVAPGIECRSAACHPGRGFGGIHFHGLGCSTSCWCGGRDAV